MSALSPFCFPLSPFLSLAAVSASRLPILYAVHCLPALGCYVCLSLAILYICFQLWAAVSASAMQSLNSMCLPALTAVSATALESFICVPALSCMSLVILYICLSVSTCVSQLLTPVLRLGSHCRQWAECQAHMRPPWAAVGPGSAHLGAMSNVGLPTSVLGWLSFYHLSFCVQ